MIIRFGLLAVFLGAGIEGEPFALAGGVLAQRHWLSPATAVLAAAAGPWLVDQMWFHLGRHYQDSRLTRNLQRRPAFNRSLALIERRPLGFVLLFRFAYGIRAVGAAAIGVSHLSKRVFVPLNLLAAILWGMVYTGLGALMGSAVEAAAARYDKLLVLAALGVSVLAWSVVLKRRD